MSLNFHQRSNKKELIDSTDVPAVETIQNLKELDTYNRLTGSIWFTIRQLEKLKLIQGKHYHLVDLGCGGGEFVVSADKWATKNNIEMTISGVDNNPIAIGYLINRIKHLKQIKAVNSDYKSFLNGEVQRIDIIHCALFTHHLNDDEIIALFRTAKKLKAILLISDLKRSKLAYYSAIAITRLMNGSSLAKHDGPLSVLRGFKKNEIKTLAQKAGVEIKCICNMPFFRYLFVITP